MRDSAPVFQFTHNQRQSSQIIFTIPINGHKPLITFIKGMGHGSSNPGSQATFSDCDKSCNFMLTKMIFFQ
jgi:hypothetical protein